MRTIVVDSRSGQAVTAHAVQITVPTQTIKVCKSHGLLTDPE
jgi:hypothetical protein